jgi:uncharacterized phage protein gp47/JayE
MPNILDSNGLQVKTREELIAEYTADFQAIYGADIVLDPDSPDGQMMNLRVQAELDLEELLVQIYNSFNPDQAIGVTLDQRVAINGIQRRAATYTTTNITITTDRALNLYGLDQNTEEIYTVSDNAGNQWQLIDTTTISAPGSYPLAFRSAVPGAVLTIPNTITQPVTIVLGVTAINNPTTYTNLGVNEESDAALRIRRAQSVALPSQGYVDGLRAALLNLEGLTYARIFENTTSGVDADGIPPHSIWVIVGGTASNADIARVIYMERSEGADMKGNETYTITRADGSPFLVRWDVVVPENLYIKFDATSIDGVTPVDVNALKNGLVLNFVPGVYEEVDITSLGTAVQAIDPNILVTNAGFARVDIGPYSNTLVPLTRNRQFAVAANRIEITVV